MERPSDHLPRMGRGVDHAYIIACQAIIVGEPSDTDATSVLIHNRRSIYKCVDPVEVYRIVLVIHDWNSTEWYT